MPSELDAIIGAIKANLAEAVALCTYDNITAHDQRDGLRLPELASAIPLVETYVRIAQGIDEQQHPLLVQFVWDKMGAPMHAMADRINKWAHDENANASARAALLKDSQQAFLEIYYCSALTLASIEGAAIGAIPETRTKIAAIGGKVDELERAAHAALATAQEAARESGLSANLNAFSSAAKDNESSARLWAIGALICALLLVTGGFIASAPESKDAWNTAQNLFFFGKHIFLASVVSFLMVTCVRNYRATRHSEVLNDHRKRALQTFERLRAGAIDERMRDAILVQATEAIFSMQVSGFADGAVGVTHAHELLELVKPSSKS
jgi:hypothetical protein